MFCQEQKVAESLTTPSIHSLEKFKSALKRRIQLRVPKDVELIDRLNIYVTGGDIHECLWHWSCYSHFSYNSRIERLEQKGSNVKKAFNT